MKVFYIAGGAFDDSNARIVAAPSTKSAAKALGLTQKKLQEHGGVTSDEAFVAVAIEYDPETVLFSEDDLTWQPVQDDQPAEEQVQAEQVQAEQVQDDGGAKDGDAVKRQQSIGDNSRSALQSYIERIQNLEKEKATLQADIREVYSEAKANGFDTKVLRGVIRKLKMDPADLKEQEELERLYLQALGIEF
jgi:uncharacterized protein (UPF0335 family)